MTDSAVTHGAEGYKSLGSGFDSELTDTENRTVRILLAVRLFYGGLMESEVVRSALEKLREQARQHGWSVVGRVGQMRLDAIRGALRGGPRSNAWLGNLDDYDECAGGKHRGLGYVVLSTDRGVGLCLSPDEVAAVVRVADRIRRRTARAERKRKDAEGARTGIDLDKRHDR